MTTGCVGGRTSQSPAMTVGEWHDDRVCGRPDESKPGDDEENGAESAPGYSFLPVEPFAALGKRTALSPVVSGGFRQQPRDTMLRCGEGAA